MTNRQSYLSWFEEWFLYFQWVWGREATRMTSLARAFDTSHETVRRILRVKLAQIGAISDSDYQRKSEVFEETQAFAYKDRKEPTESILPFTNILDKGYHCAMAAWRAGKQLLLQPVFAKSDSKFNSTQIHRSADVAADRSGNERAVKVGKHSALLKRGLEKHQDPALIADAWLVWGFQANFMFKSVMG